VSYGYPESPVFYRRLDRVYRCAVAARGATIEDEEGRTYLDASGGAMVANVGHGVPEIAAAVAEAAALGYLGGLQFTHRFVEELAAELAAVLPAPLRYGYFLASGSEAVEAAVKLARQVWVRFAERFAATAFEHGLVVWPNTGHVDGRAGDIVMLAPPFTVRSEEIAEIGRRCRRTLEELSG